MSDPYEQAFKIQTEIKELSKLMKEKEAEFAEIVSEIKKKNIQPIGYELRPSVTPSRVVNTAWFKTYEPEIYEQCVHVSHPQAVSIMTKICGNYRAFMSKLKDSEEELFEENAVLSLSDVEALVGKDEIKAIEEDGGITRSEVKSYKIVELPEFQKNLNLKRAAEGAGE